MTVLTKTFFFSDNMEQQPVILPEAACRELLRLQEAQSKKSPAHLYKSICQHLTPVRIFYPLKQQCSGEKTLTSVVLL